MTFALLKHYICITISIILSLHLGHKTIPLHSQVTHVLFSTFVGQTSSLDFIESDNRRGAGDKKGRPKFDDSSKGGNDRKGRPKFGEKGRKNVDKKGRPNLFDNDRESGDKMGRPKT